MSKTGVVACGLTKRTPRAERPHMPNQNMLITFPRRIKHLATFSPTTRHARPRGQASQGRVQAFGIEMRSVDVFLKQCPQDQKGFAPCPLTLRRAGVSQELSEDGFIHLLRGGKRGVGVGNEAGKMVRRLTGHGRILAAESALPFCHFRLSLQRLSQPLDASSAPQRSPEPVPPA